MTMTPRSSMPSAEQRYDSRKIAVVLCETWLSYYASSPFYRFLFTEHPAFEILTVGPGHRSEAEIMEIIRTGDFLGTLLCDGSAPRFAKLDVPKMILVDDLHKFSRSHTVEYYNAVHADTPCLSTYCLALPIDEFALSISRIVRTAMIYCPHYTYDLPCHRPHAERRPVSIAGTLSTLAYPMRTHLVTQLADLDPRPTRSAGRAAFIDVLGDYRIGVTDDVRFGYAVAKHFEIPMAGSLLIAPEPHSEIEKVLLGFNESNASLIPREKLYDDAYLERLIRSAAADRESTEERARAGQALVRRRHTIEARVRYIRSIFQRMQAGTWSIREQFDLFLAAERGPDTVLDDATDPVRVETSARQVTRPADGKGPHVCVAIEPGADFQAIVTAIDVWPERITVVAPTITQGERAINQLAEIYGDTEFSCLLRDRTINERLANAYDVLIVARAGQVERVSPTVGLLGWTFSPEIGVERRQTAFAFWRHVEDILKKRFGKAVIRMTLDEHFDNEWGGASFWYWLSRRDCAWVRAERIIYPSPIFGLLHGVGCAQTAVDEASSVIEPTLGAPVTTDHWQAYWTLKGFDPTAWNLEVEADAAIAEQVADFIGHLLRAAIDDVCSRADGDALM
jgi:hypothetical protein